MSDDAERAPAEQERLDAVVAAEQALLAEANAQARNRAMVERGRQIGGVAGAALAGAMIAIRDVYEGPPKDQGVVVVEASSQPEDIDRDGVELAADEIGGTHDLAVPPLPRRAPVVGRRRSRRRSSSTGDV
jgi:hypothetical protein